jgi:hypothetical protein
VYTFYIGNFTATFYDRKNSLFWSIDYNAVHCLTSFLSCWTKFLEMMLESVYGIIRMNGIKSSDHHSFLVFALFWIYELADTMGFCSLNYVNLPFHEFSHIFFGLFGGTLGVWGGALA